MYKTMADKAKEMRLALKEKLGLNRTHVSVRVGSGYGAFYIKTRTPLADSKIEAVKRICKEYESYRRCEVTQEILCGGNTFVFFRNSEGFSC